VSAVSFASLEWRDTLMPGSSAPVQLATLPRAADGAFRAFVRFPAGWSRAQRGHYPVAEEVLILEGDLQLNGRDWREGGYAWIAARRVRSDMRSRAGCLAFALFAGAPRWVPGEPAEPASEPDARFAHWRDAPGGNLRSAPGHITRVYEDSLAASSGFSGASCELLELRGRTWRLGAAPSAVEGPAFLRALSEAKTARQPP
jgi:hypothetical protein